MERANLGMSIDLGGSLTKIIGGRSEKENLVLGMEPEVIEVQRGSLEEFERDTYGATGFEVTSQ